MSYFHIYNVWIILIKLFGPFIFAAFVSLKCNDNKNGRFGQQSLLECIVVLSQDAPNVRIERVTWMIEGANKALIEYKRGSELKSEPRFTLPEPHNIHLNVSMLVTDTMIADIGNYTCIVNTNRGHCSSSAILHLSGRSGLLLIIKYIIYIKYKCFWRTGPGVFRPMFNLNICIYLCQHHTKFPLALNSSSIEQKKVS